jgi:AcrR family transcriptional regulator
MAVAEALFAERGIEGVSLSEINRAAEQGNNSALHYHFGSKDGLVAAIWEKHVERLQEPVRAAVAELGDSPTPREVVSALVRAMATRLDDPDGGAAFLRIMAQAHAKPTIRIYDRMIGGELPEEYVPFEKLFVQAAPSMPTGTLIRRMQLLTSAMYLGLASIALDEEKEPARAKRRDEMVEELITALTGMLTA